MGLSTTDWASFPLPLNLDIIQMPGCILYTDLRRTKGLTTVNGQASWDVVLPSDPEWLGRSFFQQVLVIDPSVPGLGAVMSNAAEGIIGLDSGLPQVVITEVMINPDGISDANGEWFEVHNPRTKPVNLQGWTIKDDGSDVHVIASNVVIPAGGYIVLARNGDTLQNGGVNAAYVYGDPNPLGNTGDELILLDSSQIEIDRVVWTAPCVVAGSSISLPDPLADNSSCVTWCVETLPWSGVSANNGTPGAAAGCSVF